MSAGPNLTKSQYTVHLIRNSFLLLSHVNEPEEDFVELFGEDVALLHAVDADADRTHELENNLKER